MNELADLFRHQLLGGEWEDVEYCRTQSKKRLHRIVPNSIGFYGASRFRFCGEEAGRLPRSELSVAFFGVVPRPGVVSFSFVLV